MMEFSQLSMIVTSFFTSKIPSNKTYVDNNNTNYNYNYVAVCDINSPLAYYLSIIPNHVKKK